MTKDEILDGLIDCQGIIDPEAAHIMADQLLLEYISDPGIKEAFDGVEKYYQGGVK